MATTAEIKNAIRSRLINELGMTEPPAFPVGEKPRYGLAFYHSYIMVEELYAGFSWSDIVESFYDPTSGLPSNPLIFARYISTNTANGWEQDYIYEWDGIQWFQRERKDGQPVM
jgi:hypothetical protein